MKIGIKRIPRRKTKNWIIFPQQLNFLLAFIV